MNRDEKKVMGLTIGSHGLVHLFEGVLPPLIPLFILQFNTDYFHMGLIVSIFSYAFGIGSLPAGMLVDKMGPRKLVTWYLLGAGLSCLLVGFIDSLFIYGMLMGFVGAFCSTYHPASNTLISLSINEKGSAFGIHGIAGSLGVALVPIISAWMGIWWGWKAPHIAFGIFGIALGLYSTTNPGMSQSEIHGALHSAKNKKTKPLPILNLIVFFCSATALGLTYKGIMTFLPSYLGERVHISGFQFNAVSMGGTVATIALLSGAAGQYLSGRLVDRFKAESLYLGAIAVCMIAVFLMATSQGVLLVAITVVFAFFYFSTQPLQNYIISHYLPTHRHGLGYGIHFFLSFGVGSTAAAVSGFIADQYGLSAIFYVMSACFLSATCLASILVIRNQKED